MVFIAAYCAKGHLVGTRQVPHIWSPLKTYLEQESANKQRWSNFCHECGSHVFERCPHCQNRFPREAKYCGGCGKALPWTENGLQTGREFTSGLAEFTLEEKTAINQSLEHLTSDSAMTAVAANRLRNLCSKAGPVIGNVILDIARAVATGEAKKHLGL